MKSVLSLCMLLTYMLLAGCIDLAVNDGKNKHVGLNKSAQVNGVVYTMRGGLGGIFSKGMNRLEDTLDNNYRIKASSTVWYKGSALSQSIIQGYKSKKIHGPIVLVGHSLGANEQILVAKRLAKENIPVALLITVDAVAPTAVPPNVQLAINLYKPGYVPMLSGLQLKAMNYKCTRIENINVTTLKNMNVNHFTIDSCKQVQQIMLEHVLAALKNKHVCTACYC